MPVVVQLSDFHLGVDPDPSRRLDLVLDHIRTMAEPPDAILVTGDVLDDPVVGGDYVEAGRRLAALGRPVVACPGNHDDRFAFRLLLGAEPLDEPLDTRLDLDGVTVLACDSSVPGEAWGELAPQTHAWLDRELRVGDGPVLVAVHHTPVPVGLPIIDVVRLRETDELERILRGSSRVVGVVCGHAHTTCASTFAGLPLVVCPAVSSTLRLPQEHAGSEPVFDRVSPPAFAIHLVAEGRLTSHVCAVVPPGRGR